MGTGCARITDEALEHLEHFAAVLVKDFAHRGKRILKAQVLERQQKDLVKSLVHEAAEAAGPQASTAEASKAASSG